MELNNSITDYTELEFIQLMDEIFNENSIGTSDDQLNVLLAHFRTMTEHPEGTDLIYYAASDEEGTAEAITQKVKEWRLANNKPGFKNIDYDGA